MRFFNLCILSIIVCLSLGFSSCSNEQEDEFDQTNGNIALKSRSVYDLCYVPEWWDGENQLEGPYNYQSNYQDYPYSSNTVDTCDYYYSFVYSWGNSYALQYYDRLQFQYRLAPDRYEDYHTVEEAPDSEWHNIGEVYPKERYEGGVIKRTGNVCEVDIDAHHFPKAKLNIRYRLLHTQYPYELEKYYNVLCTKWTTLMVGYNAVYNTNGFTTPDSLYFHVNLPIDGGFYSYSVVVDSEPVQTIVGGLRVCEKTKKEGRFEITALMHKMPVIDDVVVGIYRSARIEGTYNENSRDIYATFTPKDFQY